MMLQFRVWATCETGFSLFNFGHWVRRIRVSDLFDAAHRWLPSTCGEILSGRNGTLILDLFHHALEYAAAAVQAVTLDKGERKV